LALAQLETDAELVARTQAGDEHSFAELVRRHQAMVFRLALSILGREFVPEAEDVTQDVFVKVYGALPSFRGESELRSWIYRITFNQALNLKERVRFRAPHADESVLQDVASHAPGPERQLANKQRDRALAECMQTLPEVYQSALRLYYWLDTSVSQIALLLEVPENTAKSYLHRARQLLEGMLKQRGYSCD